MAAYVATYVHATTLYQKGNAALRVNITEMNTRINKVPIDQRY